MLLASGIIFSTCLHRLFHSHICHGHTRVLSYDHRQQMHSWTLKSPGALGEKIRFRSMGSLKNGNFLNDFYFCVCVCLCCVYLVVSCSWKQEECVRSLEMKLQMVVNFLMWMLGTKLKSFRKVASMLKPLSYLSSL